MPLKHVDPRFLAGLAGAVNFDIMHDVEAVHGKLWNIVHRFIRIVRVTLARAHR